MLFNSLPFILFFPAVVLLYFAFPFRYRWALLLLASYFFYGCWKAEYLLIIALSTAVDYVAARGMDTASAPGKRKACLALSLSVNLGLLFWFKYFGFFEANLGGLLSHFDLNYRASGLQIVLPVGISFYTFQKLSYIIDVYRGVTKPEHHLGRFALYVAFFPQLVAGPIERSTQLLPQFGRKNRVEWARVRSGLLLMGAGFFKKMVVADRLAAYVDGVYDHPGEFAGLSVLIATYFFAFQIFCDFSGYSDIAIGSARVLGYDLMQNFRRPYHADSVAAFWRRWHISLSTWFRDYVYIPLGGNRVARRRWLLNIAIVFLLSGLWHGASWTFILWGGLHGFYIVLGHVTGPCRSRLAGVCGLAKAPRLWRSLRVLATFHLVLFGWVFFRANSLGDVSLLFTAAGRGLGLSMAGLLGPVGLRDFLLSVGAVAVLECAHFVQRRGPLTDRVVSLPAPLRWVAYCALLFGVLLFGTFTADEFIYFQF